MQTTPLKLDPTRPQPILRLGLISDTHGFLDPRVSELLAGVDHILHAGDFGSRKVLEALNEIAPLTAVLGNTDFEPGYGVTEVVSMAAWRVLIQHIVDPERPLPGLTRQLARVRPHAVIFGHTHRCYSARHGGVLFVNPGYAGRPRLQQQRHLAILDCGQDDVRATFYDLDPALNG